jgi:desulfoferrodoxin (superoxide reductase-like protein)
MKIPVLLLAIFFAAASIAYAHPPSDIIITYDPASKVMTAVIKHNVSNPAKHYIRKVDFSVNGKEVATLKFTRQDNNLTQTVKYTFKGAKPGDRLYVEAHCNIFGKLEKGIVVK